MRNGAAVRDRPRPKIGLARFMVPMTYKPRLAGHRSSHSGRALMGTSQANALSRSSCFACRPNSSRVSNSPKMDAGLTPAAISESITHPDW